MRFIWRTLPKLALPAAMGLGLAYLVTGFLPGSEPVLRAPEELRAHGQAFSEESPVRVILERNVLHLERPPFAPPDSPLALPTEPAATTAAISRNALPGATGATPQAAFAAPDPVLAPKAAGPKTSAALSGGPRVQGLVAVPSTAALNGAAGTPGLGVEGFRLVGVIAGGDKPVAMLQVDGAAVTLRPGEQARGWTLVSVATDQVLLRQGATLRRVVLGGQANTSAK